LFESSRDSQGDCHNPSSSSPSSPTNDVSLLFAASSSSSSSLSDEVPLGTGSNGHFIFVPGEDSVEEKDNDSPQEEDASKSPASSLGSVSHYLDNCASVEVLMNRQHQTQILMMAMMTLAMRVWNKMTGPLSLLINFLKNLK
jgi:hypothetical protein